MISDATAGILTSFRAPILTAHRGGILDRAPDCLITYAKDSCEPSELTISPGKITFEVENITDRTGRLTICSLPPGSGPSKLRFVPFLTGGRLLVTQSFRELFRSELIRAAEGIAVRDMTVTPLWSTT
jgi:hypothetical protein